MYSMYSRITPAAANYYRVLHKKLQSRITEHLFVPAKHPCKAAEMWHVTVIPPQIDQQLHKRIVNWRYRSRGSQSWDDAAKRGEGKWGTSKRDGSHFGSFVRVFGRDKQIFWDSRLQVFMQNSVVSHCSHCAMDQSLLELVSEYHYIIFRTIFICVQEILSCKWRPPIIRHPSLRIRTSHRRTILWSTTRVNITLLSHM